MESKKKMVFVLVVLWVTVGVALVAFNGFINDKPKIAQEQAQSEMSFSSYAHSVTNFLNNSRKILNSNPNPPKLIP